MKYSISNWIYGDENIEKTMERLAKFHYDGIEIKGEPALYNTKRINELLQSYNLGVSSIAGIYPWPTTERDLANPDDKVRRNSINYVKSCIDFAVEIGAPLVIVVPSSVGKIKPLSTFENEWKLAIKSLRELGGYAADRNILIAVEPINRYETFLLNNAEQGLRFIDEVNVDSVKLMLDCFHMNIEERDPATSIRRVGDKLIHLHVADSNRQAPGRGHIDFRSILKALREIGYDRYLALEPLPPIPNPYEALKGFRSEEFADMCAEESINYLKRILKDER